MIKKFYDPAVVEPAANPTPSIVELMARQGVLNDTDTPVATPVSIPEKREEPIPAQEANPAAMAETAQPAETAIPEPPSPVVEPTPVPEAKQAQEPAKVQTWQEVLKSQQPDTVLKELGFDDTLVGFLKGMKEVDPKMVAFFNHWKENNGDVSNYLRELTTDYSKMTAEDVMRHQLKQDYPKATEAQINGLFNKKVIQDYNLDSDDPVEVETGRLLLEAEADRYRDQFSQKQQNFLLPKPPEPKPIEPDPQIEATRQRVEAFHSRIKNDPYTQAIHSSKQISFGEGEEKYNHPVDPAALTELLTDDSKWAESLFVKDEKGEMAPNVKKQFLVAAILADKNDGYDFLNSYATHYKGLGAKKIIEPIQNASDVPVDNSAKSEGAPTSIAEAMARQGRINNGGY